MKYSVFDDHAYYMNFTNNDQDQINQKYSDICWINIINWKLRIYFWMISEQKVWKVLQHKDRELKEHATVSIFIVCLSDYESQISFIEMVTLSVNIRDRHNLFLIITYVPQS